MFLAPFLLAALLASLAEGHLILCHLQPPAACDILDAGDSETIPAEGTPVKTTDQLLPKMIMMWRQGLQEEKPHKRGERVDGRLRIMKQG